MSIVSQHLQNLLRQTDGNILWGGYVNMLKQLISDFESPKHWVLEFLQNAEDADATRISIRLAKDSLWILNDGNTFSNEDFYTICDVKSRKLPSLGFRGYVGIGFKSIFRITDRVEVHSGNFSFGFDRQGWDEPRRKGMEISMWPWPWEILPVEITPVELQEGYTTGFLVPMESTKGQEVLEEIGQFLASDDFPKEAILLLEKVQVIEVQTARLSFTITKETVESEPLPIGKNGKRELVLVRKQVVGQPFSDESIYLVFRSTVEVDEDIRQDIETQRVRRSEISEREIGLVFLLDSENNLKATSGKLAGVYSFLPVEGEQTGLPFGIFGDFIPHPGRARINYGVKWNYWMCDKVLEFFKQIVVRVFLAHPLWKFFPAELLNSVQYSSVSGAGKEFWDTRLRNPIKEFLESEALYPDQEGITRRLSELLIAADEVVQIVGKETLEALTGKKMAHASIEGKIRSKVEVIEQGDLLSRKELLDYLKGQPEKLADVSIETVYKVLYSKEVLEPLNNQPERLATAYRRIAGLNDYRIGGRQGRESPLYTAPFVLANNGEFYPPNQIVTLEIDVASMPEWLRATLRTDKERLHPKIAQDPEAVKQLERCGLKVMNKQTVVDKLGQLINGIKTAEGCPNTWKYPDDLIQATLFLMAGGSLPIDQLVAEDGTLREPENLFSPGAPLDWAPLWEANLLPGFQPIHKSYLIKQWQEQYGLQAEQVLQCFNELGVRGFDRGKDKPLIEAAAYAIAKKRLQQPEEGHSVEDVTQRDKLGYDLECKGHCGKVFEVKGMAEPHDVPLEPSQVSAARQKKDDYILICVYNLPTHPHKVGYKEIPNPESIWDPVERAKVPREKWLML